MYKRTLRVTEMLSAPRLGRPLPGRFPFSRVLLLLITQVALSSGLCCFNQRGHYDYRDFLSWILTGNGGTCKDGSVASPCCSKGQCNPTCCDCPEPCWGEEETTTTTFAPTFSTSTSRITAGTTTTAKYGPGASNSDPAVRTNIAVAGTVAALGVMVV